MDLDRDTLARLDRRLLARLDRSGSRWCVSRRGRRDPPTCLNSKGVNPTLASNTRSPGSQR